MCLHRLWLLSWKVRGKAVGAAWWTLKKLDPGTVEVLVKAAHERGDITYSKAVEILGQSYVREWSERVNKR